ncbi:DUF1499 domain-containing protein [Colwellia sp. Arc7-635]|uniref:DUF1499 domain-containing protein n=1 Tax=Colwellia sp. Arc7-635 TaxID=2497879 RepID=UPI000F8556E3|nr:DUF1499 domain-containing protein [Colwellia sp. Arc7-635]AZQ84730.1 DUF1499 domain-containing protein [Colwellia sp. Arc7-635]
MNKLTQVAFTSLILLTGCSANAPSLGISNGQLTQCPDKPNCVNSFATGSEKFIEPIVIVGKRNEIEKDIVKIVTELENTKITVTEPNYVRAEFTSKVFGFVDDVEFYFPDTEAKDTIIHIRSGSRVGYSDLNVNRERVELLRLKLSAL